uniref:Uncharacterized protein n=1 Tax=Hydrodictyon reticulatum TaxID=3107 RepID=A0A1W5RN22_HYDRE|nr:hypothetical protein [Hydrodictyon reticulatum]AQU64579.1 hypothetical protein [Hydrodictyon reticulatum]
MHRSAASFCCSFASSLCFALLCFALLHRFALLCFASFSASLLRFSASPLLRSLQLRQSQCLRFSARFSFGRANASASPLASALAEPMPPLCSALAKPMRKEGRSRCKGSRAKKRRRKQSEEVKKVKE